MATLHLMVLGGPAPPPVPEPMHKAAAGVHSLPVIAKCEWARRPLCWEVLPQMHFTFVFRT